MRKDTKKPLTGKTLRQINILRRYYSVDMQKRVVEVRLHYENAKDMIIDDLIVTERPQIRNDVLERISEIETYIPDEFSVHFSLQVDDYQGYDHKLLLDALCDALEIFHNTHLEKKRHMTGKSALIMIGGLIFLTVWGAMEVLMTEDQSSTQVILKEFLNMFSCALLTEAVIWAFLEARETNSIEYDFVRKFSEISFLDASGQVKCVMAREEIIKEWHLIDRTDLRVRTTVLIFGVIQLCLNILLLGDVSVTLKDAHETTSNLFTSFDVVNIIASCIAGIGAVSLYRGRGIFRTATLPATSLVIVLDIVQMIIVLTQLKDYLHSIGLIATVYFCLILVIGLTCIALISRILKKDKENLESEMKALTKVYK